MVAWSAYVEAVVQRQERVMPKGDDDRLVFR